MRPRRKQEKERRPDLKSIKGDAEEWILEITEVAFILKNDGFPEPEISRRLGLIFDPPPPPYDTLGGSEVFYCLREYIEENCPEYLECDSEVSVFTTGQDRNPVIIISKTTIAAIANLREVLRSNSL